MKIPFVLLLPYMVAGFVPITNFKRSPVTALKNYETTVTEENLNRKLEDIAKTLRLQTYDVNTGVYGFESKDKALGIENIRVNIPIEPSLGLEMTEVAHGNRDNRGLVLVSKVSGNAAKDTSIQVGDTIVGVFVEGADFKESVTGMDYESTMDVITQAKTTAHLMGEEGGGSISLELNRLVPRAAVHVVVEGASNEPVTIDGLAGDNLSLLLMNHGMDIYSKRLHRLDQPSVTGMNCGGEGICGTCMVKILEGEEHLGKLGPKEKEIKTGRPQDWRAACQTVIGVDNNESTIRVLIHPQWSQDGRD